jgi:glycosyltransferase involved in cell wall biosynthesis
MNVLFLSLSTAIRNIENRGIYPDLLRKFHETGNTIYLVCPAERREYSKTRLSFNSNFPTLIVKTPNITKTNIIEKGLSTLIIDTLYGRAIRKYFRHTKFDLILYSTPPITFHRLINRLKRQHGAITYLLLKDIFPQNAVDLGMLTTFNPLYYFFRAKEKNLYKISDHIGCMSPANVMYLLRSNPWVSPDKVEVCPNSIEPVYEDTEKDNYHIREKYGIPKDKIVCIYGGNLGKPQGIDFLIEVLSANMNRNDVFFVLAGSGTEKHKLDKFVSSKKPNNIIQLSELPRIEYDQLVSVCDVGLIFLDKRFTIPNYPTRLLNYLEFRKPVLMAIDRHTDLGTIAEENQYGVWVESGDLVQFNNKLNDLVSNPVLIKRMGENGYQYLMANYTADKQYDIIMSHFM